MIWKRAHGYSPADHPESGGVRRAHGRGGAASEADDRVFIADEDSNTISLIDPRGHAEGIIAGQRVEIAAMQKRLAILRAGRDPEPGGFPARGGPRGPAAPGGPESR